MRKALIDRFEEKFIPEPNSGCWIWTGALSDRGYGRFQLNGQNQVASRVSFQIYRCEPGHLHVLHKCDFPACVNPDHLFLGTNRDNCLDKAVKGRIPHAKLNKSDVPIVRYLLDRGATHTAIGQVFGVSETTIRHIFKGEVWNHVS